MMTRVYLIHGGRDTLIPPEQGQRLYGLINGEKEFLYLPEAGHGPLLGDEALRTFLERILSPDGNPEEWSRSYGNMGIL